MDEWPTATPDGNPEFPASDLPALPSPPISTIHFPTGQGHQQYLDSSKVAGSNKIGTASTDK